MVSPKRLVTEVAVTTFRLQFSSTIMIEHNGILNSHLAW